MILYISYTSIKFFKKIIYTDVNKPTDDGLPWWISGKSLPDNAGDTDSTPDLGRSHVPRSN